MDQILNSIVVQVTDEVYLKDPLSSELGKKIIHESLFLIADLGMEGFTFKKLADRVGSTEGAIYRYFENKHKLLVYLTAWYWGWLEHHLVFYISNLADPYEKMRIAIKLLVEGPHTKKNQYLDPEMLTQIVTEESYKSFLTKEVDIENQNGYFKHFHRLSARLVALVKEINPSYKYPKTLISTLMEATLLHAYFRKHMPAMTEVGLVGDEKVDFYNELIFKTLKNES
ncbi:TetR/AcrR family transcriptional regulator [Lunatimonas salinarum]|uniref:TetR/AcrR family transcriptional regulator n=1 Tax=Lunatimonas salinarum TaxID=1774590 RepID=UPI001ADFA2F7|nr:TetR/AcrR family transcriptional regulator [Lunatimonas salinarum]